MIQISLFIVFFLKLMVSDYQTIGFKQVALNYNFAFNPLQKKSLGFKPDSSINNRLFLDYDQSVFAFCQDKKKIHLIEHIRESSVVIFSNQQKDEYLLTYFYEGNTQYAYSCFEIGYFEDDAKVKKNLAIVSKEALFKTESNLGLGSALAEVIQVKGKNYKTRTFGKDTILTYYLSDKNAFVKRYFMPGYFMEFKVRDNKVRRITFGFDYP
jgi:hypothetical protein